MRVRLPPPPFLNFFVRQIFGSLGLDSENFGTPKWNPLGNLVRPGQTVLLKPNFVTSFNGSGDDLFAVVTHPSILRALVDYVHLALRGEGRIIIADAPDMSCQWNDLMKAQRLDAVQDWYRHRHGFALEATLRNVLLGKMLPDPLPLVVAQSQHTKRIVGTYAYRLNHLI